MLPRPISEATELLSDSVLTTQNIFVILIVSVRKISALLILKKEVSLCLTTQKINPPNS